MRFPETIAVMRQGGSIKAALLIFMDFKDDPRRVWTGFGDLKTVDGAVWSGIGDVVSIEGGGAQSGAVAGNMTLTIPATDEMVAKALASEAQVYGRRIYTAVQFFTEDWQPTDSFRVVFSGVMDRMNFNLSSDRQTISLNAESPFVRRRTERLIVGSDRDRRARFPNDRMFEFVSTLVNKTVTWPRFT